MKCFIEETKGCRAQDTKQENGRCCGSHLTNWLSGSFFFGGSQFFLFRLWVFSVVDFWREALELRGCEKSCQDFGMLPGEGKTRLDESNQIYEWNPQIFSVGPWISITRAIATHTREKFSQRMKMMKSCRTKRHRAIFNVNLTVKDIPYKSLWIARSPNEERPAFAKKAQHHPWQWKFPVRSRVICSLIRECVWVRKKKIFLSKRAYPPWNFPSNEENFVVKTIFSSDEFLAQAMTEHAVLHHQRWITIHQTYPSQLTRRLLFALALPRFLPPKTSSANSRHKNTILARLQWMKF